MNERREDSEEQLYDRALLLYGRKRNELLASTKCSDMEAIVFPTLITFDSMG